MWVCLRKSECQTDFLFSFFYGQLSLTPPAQWTEENGLTKKLKEKESFFLSAVPFFVCFFCSTFSSKCLGIGIMSSHNFSHLWSKNSMTFVINIICCYGLFFIFIFYFFLFFQSNNKNGCNCQIIIRFNRKMQCCVISYIAIKMEITLNLSLSNYKVLCLQCLNACHIIIVNNLRKVN